MSSRPSYLLSRLGLSGNLADISNVGHPGRFEYVQIMGLLSWYSPGISPHDGSRSSIVFYVIKMVEDMPAQLAN